MAQAIPKRQITGNENLCREIALPTSEVTMGASASKAAFVGLPWPQGASALAQFHPEPNLNVTGAVQSPDTDSFVKRTELADAGPTEISFGSFRLLPTQFLLLEDNKPVTLGSRALQILIVLLERPGELVSKEKLMARVWPNIFVEPANLTVHVSALRRALRDGGDGNRFIINIPGRGYQFVAPVEVSVRENNIQAFENPLLPRRSLPGSELIASD